MKILLTSVLNPWESGHGGGQVLTHDLAAALARRGHEITVGYSTRDPSVIPAGLPYATDNVRHTERVYLTPLKRALRVAKRGVGRWDIVHAQGLEGAFLSLALKRACPLVTTSHHPDPPELHVVPARWRPLARMRWVWLHIAALLERRALIHADHVVCTSRHSEILLRSRGYLRSDARVTVVHSGVSVAGVEATAQRAHVLLCVARLDGHKGIDVLLQAIARLGPETGLLEIYGEGLEEARLKNLARSLGIEHRVSFRGRVARGDVLARIAQAEVLVLPSRAENFPGVVLEAMALGTAIVATNVGGIPEAVTSEREALLVEPNDPQALADAIGRLARSRDLRQELAANAFARAREFTWERSATKLEGLYQGLLHRPSTAASNDPCGPASRDSER